MHYFRFVWTILLLVASGAYAGTQVVISSPSIQAATALQAVGFTASYQTRNPRDDTLAGLGLRIHYDSSQLTFVDLSDLFARGVQPVADQLDTLDQDGNPATDRVILVSWIDFGGDWPGVDNSPLDTLFTAHFLTTAGFTRTKVNYTASTSVGYSLDAAPVRIGGVTTVPDVAGMTSSAAEEAIVAAGLSVGNRGLQHSATVGNGKVISQSPAPGSSVAEESDVDLVVSSGPTLVDVPDTVGSTRAAALAVLADAGFSIGSVSEQGDAAVAPGVVIGQSPPGGARVAEESEINLIVSSGPIVVPDVVGYNKLTAGSTILEVGLEPDYTRRSSELPAGTVIEQVPAAGSQVSFGDSVRLIISGEPQIYFGSAGVTLLNFNNGNVSFQVLGGAVGVPTLSEWALMLLSVLVGLLAWYRWNAERAA